MLYKRHAALALVAFLLFACSSCSPYVFPHAEPVKATWDVSVRFDPTVAPVTQQGIIKELETMMAKSRMTDVRFVMDTDTTACDMTLTIGGYRAVTKDQQALGVLSTLIGVASAGIGFGFVIIPRSSTIAQVDVHDGDKNSHTRRKTQAVGGPGFLKTMEKQFIKHPKGYRKFFKSMLKWYKKDLKRAKKKGRPVV